MNTEEQHMARMKMLNAILSRLDRIDDTTRHIMSIMELRKKNRE